MCEVLRELDLPPAVFWVATTIQYVLKIGSTYLPTRYLDTIPPFQEGNGIRREVQPLYW